MNKDFNYADLLGKFLNAKGVGELMSVKQEHEEAVNKDFQAFVEDKVKEAMNSGDKRLYTNLSYLSNFLSNLNIR